MSKTMDIANIIDSSRLSLAAIANAGLPPLEYEGELLKVAQEIIKYFENNKK